MHNDKRLKVKFYLRGLATGLVIAVVLMAATSGNRDTMSNEEIMARAEKLGMVKEVKTLRDSDQVKADESTQVAQKDESAKPVDSEVEKSQESVSGSESGEDQSNLKATEETKGSGEIVKESEEAKKDSEKTVKESEDEKKESEDSVKESKEKVEEIKDSETESESTRESQEDMKESTEASSENETEGSSQSEETPATSQENENTPQPSESEQNEYILVIQKGYSSTKVARLLAEMGLVENADEYDKFLCRNGYDSKICVGTFKIPAGSTKEEIARIITSHP